MYAIIVNSSARTQRSRRERMPAPEKTIKYKYTYDCCLIVSRARQRRRDDGPCQTMQRNVSLARSGHRLSAQYSAPFSIAVARRPVFLSHTPKCLHFLVSPSLSRHRADTFITTPRFHPHVGYLGGHREQCYTPRDFFQSRIQFWGIIWCRCYSVHSDEQGD